MSFGSHMSVLEVLWDHTPETLKILETSERRQSSRQPNKLFGAHVRNFQSRHTSFGSHMSVSEVLWDHTPETLEILETSERRRSSRKPHKLIGVHVRNFQSQHTSLAVPRWPRRPRLHVKYKQISTSFGAYVSQFQNHGIHHWQSPQRPWRPRSHVKYKQFRSKNSYFSGRNYLDLTWETSNHDIRHMDRICPFRRFCESIHPKTRALASAKQPKKLRVLAVGAPADSFFSYDLEGKNIKAQ